MKTLSKICDAADWFDKEFAEVVKMNCVNQLDFIANSGNLHKYFYH